MNTPSPSTKTSLSAADTDSRRVAKWNVIQRKFRIRQKLREPSRGLNEIPPAKKVSNEIFKYILI